MGSVRMLAKSRTARWASRSTRADRILVRVLVGPLCLLTLVIVVSALHTVSALSLGPRHGFYGAVGSQIQALSVLSQALVVTPQ